MGHSSLRLRPGLLPSHWSELVTCPFFFFGPAIDLGLYLLTVLLGCGSMMCTRDDVTMIVQGTKDFSFYTMAVSEPFPLSCSLMSLHAILTVNDIHAVVTRGSYSHSLQEKRIED